MTLRLNTVIFCLAAITGIAVRTVMLLFTVENSSGFIKADYFFYAVGIIAFLIVSAVIIFTSAMLVKAKNTTPPAGSNKLFAAACAIAAVAFAYETFFSPLLENAKTSQQALHYVITLAAVISLFYTAFCKFTSREFPAIISIIPVIYWIMRLIIIFSEFSTISTISDTVLEIAAMCLSLITFLFYAKIEAEQPLKNYKLIFAISLLSGYVCIISSIPRIFTDTLSQSIHLNTIPAFTGIASAAFCVIFAYTLLNEISKPINKLP